MFVNRNKIPILEYDSEMNQNLVYGFCFNIDEHYKLRHLWNTITSPNPYMYSFGWWMDLYLDGRSDR